jgi:hypothetical protein
VQSDWSVSQMRAQRWEAIGAPPELKPRDQDIVSAELDEDVSPALDAADSAVATRLGKVRAPTPEETFEPDFGDERSAEDEPSSKTAAETAAEERDAAEPRSRPFAQLPELPSDLAEAFENFKLAILRHKMTDWKDVARDDVLATLDALKELTLAP